MALGSNGPARVEPELHFELKITNQELMSIYLMNAGDRACQQHLQHLQPAVLAQTQIIEAIVALHESNGEKFMEIYNAANAWAVDLMLAQVEYTYVFGMETTVTSSDLL